MLKMARANGSNAALLVLMLCISYVTFSQARWLKGQAVNTGHRRLLQDGLYSTPDVSALDNTPAPAADFQSTPEPAVDFQPDQPFSASETPSYSADQWNQPAASSNDNDWGSSDSSNNWGGSDNLGTTDNNPIYTPQQEQQAQPTPDPVATPTELLDTDSGSDSPVEIPSSQQGDTSSGWSTDSTSGNIDGNFVDTQQVDTGSTNTQHDVPDQAVHNDANNQGTGSGEAPNNGATDSASNPEGNVVGNTPEGQNGGEGQPGASGPVEPVLPEPVPIATVQPNTETFNALQSSDTSAAVQEIINAASGNSDAATAAGAAMAQAVQDGKTSAVAEATAVAAAQDPSAAAVVMAEAQAQAVARGATGQLAESTAEAFSVAAQQGTVDQLSQSFAQATAQSAATNPEATSHVLAESFIASANRGDDVRKSFASATAEAFKVAQNQGSNNLDSLSSAMAAASAEAAATNVLAAAQSLAATAVQAASVGVIDSFARSQALAFSASRRQNNVGSFARAVASAIRDGGAPASEAYSAAFAKAIAAGGNQAAGLAVATAEVFCEGGASAEAWAEALSRAISQDQTTGCTILTESRSYAYAKCGPTGAFATSGSKTTQSVLGTCRLTPTTYGNVQPSALWGQPNTYNYWPAYYGNNNYGSLWQSFWPSGWGSYWGKR